MANRIQRYIGQRKAQISVAALNAELDGGCLVMEMEIPLDVVDGNPDRWGIAHYVKQGAYVSGIEMLAEVKAEAFITGLPRGAVEYTRKARGRNKPVRLNEKRRFESQRPQYAFGISTGRCNGIQQTCCRCNGDD